MKTYLNLSELANILSVKSEIRSNILALFSRFGIGHLLCHMSLEKPQGISAVQLILSLCMFRVGGETIHSIYKKGFRELLDTGKNCYYRMMIRTSMNWHKLLYVQVNFPQYHLVNNCATGKLASIPDGMMRHFMKIAQTEPECVTFLCDAFVKFAKDHVKLRVLTDLLKGQEGYVVRILRDRQLMMDFGGNTIALSNVHNEDFEVAE